MSNPLKQVPLFVITILLAACGGSLPFRQQQSQYSGDVPQVTVEPKVDEGCSLPEGMVFDHDGGSKQQKHDASTIAKLRAAGYVPVRTVDGAITWHCGRTPTASPLPAKAVVPVALAAKSTTVKPTAAPQKHHAAKKAAKKAKETTPEAVPDDRNRCTVDVGKDQTGTCSVNGKDLTISPEIFNVIKDALKDKLIGDDKKPTTPPAPAPAPAAPEAKPSFFKKMKSLL